MKITIQIEDGRTEINDKYGIRPNYYKIIRDIQNFLLQKNKRLGIKDFERIIEENGFYFVYRPEHIDGK